MPTTKFKCPLERIEVEFDHFESCTARKGRPAFPPWMAKLHATKQANDVRHSTLDLTATRTMGCPRQTYLEVMFEHVIDPAKLALRLRGTAMHEIAEKYWDKEYWLTEKSDPVRMTIPGTLGGYTVSMLCDVLRKDLKEIVDMKFPMDFSVRYRKDTAKLEASIQLNLARLFLGEQEWAKGEGYDPDDVLLTIWDHAIGYDAGPVALAAPHMTEDRILGSRPFGGEFTVGQILEVHAWMHAQQLKNEEAGKDTVEARERLAASLPLVGVTMMNNKKCPQYCDMEKMCSELVRKYGEPDVEFDDG